MRGTPINLPGPSAVAWPNSAAAVQMILTHALSRCAHSKGLNGWHEVIPRLACGEAEALRCFNATIVEEVAAHLGAWDEDIRAIYTYDEGLPEPDGAGDDRSPIQPFQLIVWVQPKTAALASLIASLDRALGQSLAALLNAPAPTRILNVMLVDDEEMRERAGFAALLISRRDMPARVWNRAKGGSGE